MNAEKTMNDCITEMFKRVGEKYPNEELTKQDKWFQKRSWTEAEEDDFRDWMTKLLKKRHKWTNKKIQLEVGMFLLDYGWKYKDKTQSVEE